jgi:hypothetical protein
VVERLRSAGNRPDQIEVAFGVKLTTTAGAVITSAAAEANFNVTLRWTEKTKDEAL